MVKAKTILFIFGLLSIIWGAYPLLAGIKALETLFKGFPQPGNIFYQLVIILIGIIAIGYSVKRKPVVVPRE
jgi:hypothetical protein